MSNILKSKVLLGAMILGAVFVGAMALAIMPAEASYTHTVTLKMGMTSPQVLSLQQTLNSNGFIVASVGAGSPGMETNYFGQLTVNAVKAFQTSKGLSMVDGVVGHQTGTALAAMTGGSVVHPAGCTSSSGFSTTTGVSCSSSLYPAGCTSTSGFSTTTGNSCAGTSSSLPAGCSSTSGFSSTTGASCSTGGSPSTGSGTDEGELNNFDSVSADENSFSEGEENELYAFEMEADGSDMMVSRVDIYMGQTTTAESNNADDYFSSATLWVDGEEVATLDVEDWDEDDWDQTADVDNDEFRLRFDADFTVDEGETARVSVSFEAANNIDSGDSDNATWQIDLATDSIRAEDEAGFTDEYGESNEETIAVDDVQVGELDVSLSTDNPEEQVVSVDATDDTDGIELLAFDLEANDGDIFIDELVVTVDDVGTLTDVNAVVKTLHLFRDGVEIASESLPTSSGQTELVTFDIDEDDAEEGLIEDGDTAEFTVEGDIENIQAGAVGDFDEGDGVVLSFTSVLAEDEAGDNVEADGTANGENMTFYTVAPLVTHVSDDIDKTAGETPSAEATDDTADGTIVFTVKAIGGTIYINGDNESTDEKEGILLTDGQGGDLDVLGDYSYTVTGSNIQTTNAGADNEYFTIPEGATATFTLSFHLDPATTSGFYGGNVSSIQFGTVSTDQDTRTASAVTTGVVADDLETALVQLTDGA